MKSFKATNARAMASRLAGAPRSIFYGDPVEISDQSAAKVVAADAAPQDEIDEALVTSANPESAAQRIAAYDEMTRSERADFTLAPALSVANAVVTVKPVTRDVPCANLNYLLTRALIDFPINGFVKTAAGAGVGVATTMTIAAADVPEGLAAVPFFRFNISASNLNARPGGTYNISLTFVTPEGRTISTANYTFQRQENTRPIVGVMIPFMTIATRTLPQLARIDSASSLVISIVGMSADETLAVTIPGYSTEETKAVAEVYQLAAGQLI